jgi:sortase A
MAGRLERSLLIGGLLLLAIYAAARLDGFLQSRAALRKFSTTRQSFTTNRPSNYAEQLEAAQPDLTLWAEKRIKEYRDHLMIQGPSAQAILRVPKIRLEVPVLEGTDELTLNRGAGRIAGTAHLGEEGNIGIAAHRDGFFRGLKDVSTGDSIDVVTVKGIESYVVDHILIVDPSDTSVLQPRSQPSLTLVTCYPFYFVGNAPKRYIVQAVVADSARNMTQAEGR